MLCFCHSQNYSAGFANGLNKLGEQEPLAYVTRLLNHPIVLQPMPINSGFSRDILSTHQSKQLIHGSFGFSNFRLQGSTDLRSNALNSILTRIPLLPLLKVHFCKNWKSSADSTLIIVSNDSFITAQHKTYTSNAYWRTHLKMCFSWKKKYKTKQNKPSFLFKIHEKESTVCYKKVTYTLGAQRNLYRSIRCALDRNSSLLRYLKDKCYPQISV